MKKLTDLIIERNRLASTAPDLLNATGDSIYTIAKDLEPYAPALARAVLQNPANNKPFADAITAMRDEAIRANPDMTNHLDLNQLAKAADCLRLATIEAVLKEIEAGRITPPDDGELTAPVLSPVVAPLPPKKKSIVAMPAEWTGTKKFNDA